MACIGMECNMNVCAHLWGGYWVVSLCACGDGERGTGKGGDVMVSEWGGRGNRECIGGCSVSLR